MDQTEFFVAKIKSLSFKFQRVKRTNALTLSQSQAREEITVVLYAQKPPYSDTRPHVGIRRINFVFMALQYNTKQIRILL